MARLPAEVDSANSQFFINVVDNEFLNFKGNTPEDYGYTAFGKVTSGMDVVDAISKLSTTSKNGYDDVPSEIFKIISVTQK